MCLIPIWKEKTNLKPSFWNIESGEHLDTDIGQGSKSPPTKAGSKPAWWGVAAPWLAPNWPSFVGLSSIISWTCPMVVLREVEMVWLEFGLVLCSFGP